MQNVNFLLRLISNDDFADCFHVFVDLIYCFIVFLEWGGGKVCWSLELGSGTNYRNRLKFKSIKVENV